MNEPLRSTEILNGWHLIALLFATSFRSVFAPLPR
jgi:hypothetical protein